MASRRFRPFDIVLLVAAAAALLPAPLSVRDAAWVEHLDLVPPLALAGLLYGYLFARTRLPGALAQPALTVVGLEAVVYVFTRVAPGDDLSNRAAWLLGRVAGWFQTVASGGVSNDALVFALAMGGLAWLLGAATAWLVFRDELPWPALIGIGIALFVNLSYAPPALAWYLSWFLFAACLLLAVHQLSLRQALWQRAGLPIEPRVGVTVVAGSAVTAAVLLALAWALPDGGLNPAVSGAWDRVTTPWQNVERGFDRLFASLNGNDRTLRGLNFGRTLAPRGSFDLGDTPVLQVSGPRGLYLRATTADRYTGQAITGSEAASTPVAAGADLLPSDDLPAERSEVRATVKVLASRSAVAFAPEAPLHLSVPSHLDERGGTPEDVAAIRLDAPVLHDDTYDAVSLASTASIQQLRAAGEAYPDWVSQRYLQLPQRLPRRVVDAAHEATLGTTSAYDKAVAVEQFLRTDFTYSTHVADVPPDRDWVDFFLFDSREGYCDFFATAMTVMLRTQGVPARVASGFAPGEYDASTGASLVRESEAHTWVEVYFPRYGWITFEPSSIRSVPERLDMPDPAPAAADAPVTGSTDQALTPDELNELRSLGDGGSAETVAPPFYATPAGIAALALLTILLMGAASVGAATLAWRRGLGRLARYQRPYAELLRVSGWFGRFRPPASHTPFEVADVLSARAPGVAPVIRDVAAAYVEGTYAARPPALDPWPTWSGVRRQLARSLLAAGLRRAGQRLARRRRR